MPSLNQSYKKWDSLEVSDDSDIEGHPNVDHKSLVRWKQRDIHEKREARKRLIAEYKAIVALNEVLIPRVERIVTDVEEGGQGKYSSLVERLRTQPSDEKPPGGGGGGQTYDEMLCNLLLKNKDELKEAGINSPDGNQLANGLKAHLIKMRQASVSAKEGIDEEEKEAKKKITSEDIHEGFSATNVAKEPPEEPKPKKKAKAKETHIETLNPGTQPGPLPDQATTSEVVDADDEDERLSELSETLVAFSKIPMGNFLKSFQFIKQHPREVMREDNYDKLVLAGFRAAMAGKKKYAKQCVHQALIIQYCAKLGRDGVSLFFKRIADPEAKAKVIFDDDLDKTYGMMMERAQNALYEEEHGRERIQLVAEDPSHNITFNVPDGPPPEKLVLEGPGTEELDIEEVRKALQLRWNIFREFEPELQTALKSGSLEKVNDVLGEMEVPRAESVVKLLEVAGILSFSREGIVDETEQANTADPGEPAST